MFVHIKRRPAVWLVMSLLLMLTIALVPPPAYAAGSFTVNTTTDGHDATPGNGVCETVTGNGVCTLRAAIEESNALGATNTIGFSVNGTFTLSLGELHVTGSPAQTTTITGSGQTTTVVDANKASRVFEIDSGASLTMSGVTVQHGSVVGDGGGIRNSGTLKLSNSLVSSNAAVKDTTGGGGISNTATGTANLDTVTIDSNTATAASTLTTAATDGGGIENVGLLTFTNGTVSNNSAKPLTAFSGGGGIAIDGPQTAGTALTNLDMHDNTAGDGGAIVDSSNGANTLTNVTLHANHAASTRGGGGFGGGLTAFTSGGSPDTLTNVTVDGNTSTGDGGGLTDDGAGLNLINVTIANNTATLQGGGLISRNTQDNVKYTILSANVPNNCALAFAGSIVSGGQSIENGSSCGFTAPADKPSTDPLLQALANNPGPNAFVPPTDALPANSPAVDFSPAGTCPPPATDERGVTRPQGAACDSGAYELIQAGPPPPPRCDNDGDGAVKVDRHHRRHCRDKDND